MPKETELDMHLVRALNLAKDLPKARETALVITKIEESIFWLQDYVRKNEGPERG